MQRAKLRSLIIPAVRTVAPSCFASAECKNERELLHGIEGVSIAQEYSRRIISNDATALLRDTEYMYNCAFRGAHGDDQACNKSLEEIIQTGNRFMQNQVEVSDRQSLDQIFFSAVKALASRSQETAWKSRIWTVTSSQIFEEDTAVLCCQDYLPSLTSEGSIMKCLGCSEGWASSWE